MIENGRITYQAVESALSSWQIENDILHAFVVSTFSTILSYQITSLLIDLVLGVKPAGETRIRNIASLMLSQESSPMAIVRSLLTNRAAANTRSNRSGHVLTGREGHLTISALVKLLLLVSIAPVINLATVAMTVENDRVFSFRDVSFGGMALGTVENESNIVESTTRVGSCWNLAREKPDSTENIRYVAAFFMCNDLLITFVLSNSPFTTNFSLEVRTDAKQATRITVNTAQQRWTVFVFANLLTQDKVYRLHQRIRPEDGNKILTRGEELLEAHICLPGLPLLQIGERITRDGSFFTLERTYTQCHGALLGDETSQKAMARYFFGQIKFEFTLVNDGRLDVAPEDELEQDIVNNIAFKSGADLAIISWRRSAISGALIGILAAASIVLRVIVKIFTNNDLDMGLELLIKKQLNLNLFDSMLQNSGRAYYRRQTDGTIK